MAASSTLIALRTLFSVLGCLMLATLVYTIVTDGSPFRRELLTPWMTATLVDFYVNVVALAVWVAYKETALINAILWIILLVCFGSITTCAYIVKNLYNISSQDLMLDPVCHLLLRKGGEQKLKRCSVVLGRILFTFLGVLVLAIVVYTSITDGLPFRMELLTPWMAATLIDFYINVAAISASFTILIIPTAFQAFLGECKWMMWVAYKESSWITALFWIILLICFGSTWATNGTAVIVCHFMYTVAFIVPFQDPVMKGAVHWDAVIITTCAYIVIQLFRLKCQEPIYHVLLDSHSKHETSTPAK